MNWQHLDSMGGEIISLAELMIAGNGSNCQQRIQEEKWDTEEKMGHERKKEKKKWDLSLRWTTYSTFSFNLN